MFDPKLAAWWFHRQGLDGSLEGATAAQVLERAGWARSVGGVGPYLTLWSRARIGREAADRAVAQLEIHELPAARGCTYVVPAAHFALALEVGEPFGAAELAQATKLGVTAAELATLRAKVLGAVKKGPLDPEGIRAAVGAAARSLGEAGKKKGISTTLPLALGPLQSAGAIRRVPVNGRLDQQRYAYALWQPNPVAGARAPADGWLTELGRHYFRWVGPATAAEFQWFAGLGVKAAAAALAPLGLVPVAPGSARLLLPDDRAAFDRFRPPPKPRYALVGSLDSIQAHRRSLDGMLTDADRARKLWTDKAIAPSAGFADFPAHAILDRGRLVGIWEYDPDQGAIVAVRFGIKDPALDRAIAAAEAFVRDELGDARSFSLDSPKSRIPRLAALRKLA